LKKVKFLPILMCTFLMNGCWDKIEIDRNIFIGAVGLDPGKDIKSDEELQKVKPDEPFGERKLERLNVTYAFPDISEYNAQKGALPEDKYLRAEAYSMEDAETNATAKSSRNINIGHVRLLAISNDIFKYPNVLKEIIDYISRHPRMNRMMNVVVVDGRAEDFFKGDLLMEKNIHTYIEGLMQSSERSSTVFPVNLNEFLILLSQNGNALLPNVKYDKAEQELMVTGVSVIKAYSIKGSLTPQETSVLEMFRGKLKGGKKVIYVEGHPIDMEIDGVERKIKVDMNDDRLAFDIGLNIEGRIKGYFIEKSILGQQKIGELEDNFSKSISEECVRVIRLTQKELNVDPSGLREYIEKFHPFMWDKIKNKWEDYYKDATINVQVETNIRRVGVIK
jgi:spore germination protein